MLEALYRASCICSHVWIARQQILGEVRQSGLTVDPTLNYCRNHSHASKLCVQKSTYWHCQIVTEHHALSWACCHLAGATQLATDQMEDDPWTVYQTGDLPVYVAL